MNSSDENAYTNYKEALETDLKQNVKPVITALSMLAEDYKNNANSIANAIEDYIRQIPPEMKILGLYLMDSIMKNHKYTTNYNEVFETRILNLFSHVFENVDEQNRKALYKLRLTWNEVFSNRTLYDVDVRIKQIDHAWPITATNNLPPLNNQTNLQSRPQPDNLSVNSSNSIASHIGNTSSSISSLSISSQKIPTKQLVTKITSKMTDIVKKNNILLNNSVESLATKSDSRDPRIRKIKPLQNIGIDKVSVIETNIFEPKANNKTINISASPIKNKSKVVTNNVSIHSSNGLKRSSPNSLNQGDVKKPKLTGNQTSPVGSDKFTKINKTSKSKIVQQPLKTERSQEESVKSNPKSLKVQKANISKVGITSLQSNELIKPTVKPLSSTTNNKSTDLLSTIKQKQNINKTKLPDQQNKIFSKTEEIKSSININIGSNNNKLYTLKNDDIDKSSTKNEISKKINSSYSDDVNSKSNLPRLSKTIFDPDVKTDSTIINKEKQENKKESDIHLTKSSQRYVSQMTFKDVDERVFSSTDVDERSESIKDESLNTHESNIFSTEKLNELGNLISQSKSVDQILLNSKSSLNDLENQLKISKQNDKESGSQEVSKNTEHLLEMIGKILELTQRKVDNQKALQINDFSSQKQQCMPLMTLTPAPSDFLNNEPRNINDGRLNLSDYNDLPPIKPRDKTENQNDSLLIIDGRSYTIQPQVVRLIRVYYHDHELFCDTRTKEVFIDKKRVYRMGETTKEVILNGRKVRLMYMGKRIEVWIDGISFHFRADSPPKLISITSKNSQIKRYYVTIDGRTMNMSFNNYEVCQIKPTLNTQGPQNQSNTLMCKLAPDDYEKHEISFVCPPKKIQIDGIQRTMRYDLAVPCIEMENNSFYIIRFSGPPRDIYIDDIPYLVPLDKTVRIKLNGRAHELAWGGPGFEVIIDGRPYELQFNQPSREVIVGTKPHFIYICGETPDVKICGQLPYELQQPFVHDSDILTETKQTPPHSNFDSKQSKGSMDFNINVSDLLKKLKDHNIINLGQADSKSTDSKKIQLPSTLADIISSTSCKKTTSVEELNQAEKIPDLTSFETNLLKQKYSGAIQSLYSGVQCATCGNRFNQTDTQTAAGGSRYSKHLDWHFRQNKKEKDEVNKAHSRAWYYLLMEWFQFEELSEDAMQSHTEMEQLMPPPSSNILQQDPIESLNKNKIASRLNNEKDDNENDENQLLDDLSMPHPNGGARLSTQTSFTAGLTTCPATDDIDDKCCICKDFFEIFFYQEREEWHFKDAVRVGHRLYHPICYEDACEDSNVNNTPLTNSVFPPLFSNSLNGSLMDDSSLRDLMNIETTTANLTTSEIKNEPSECNNIINYDNLGDPNNDEFPNHTNSAVEMKEDDGTFTNGSLSIRLVSSCYDDVLKEETKHEPGSP